MLKANGELWRHEGMNLKKICVAGGFMTVQIDTNKPSKNLNYEGVERLNLSLFDAYKERRGR